MKPLFFFFYITLVKSPSFTTTEGNGDHDYFVDTEFCLVVQIFVLKDFFHESPPNTVWTAPSQLFMSFSNVHVFESKLPMYEKWLTYSSCLYDLKKAFGTTLRPVMRSILQLFNCPNQFISLVQGLHYGMTGTVFHQNQLFKYFSITRGLKQACILAPTLFSVLCSKVSWTAFGQSRTGCLTVW